MILRIRLPSGVTERVTLSETEGLSELGQKINDLNKLEGQFSLYSDPRFTQPFVFENAKHGDVVFIQGTAIPAPSPAPTTTAATTTTISNDNEMTKSTDENTEETTNGDAASSSSSKKTVGPGLRCRHGPRGMCEHCMPKEDKRARAEAELKKHGKRSSSIAVLEALEALKFKISPQESAYASSAAINKDAADSFRSYLVDTSFSQQRIGFCYGSVSISEVDEDTDKKDKDNTTTDESTPTEKLTTNVHAIYEPPQTGDADTYALVADQDEQAGDITQRAHSVANLLNLKHVGMVISARPRKCMISAKDVVFAARTLSKLSEEERKSFIIFIVSTSETGQIQFEAYQLSDLVVEMYEDDIFEDLSKQKANGGRVLCKQDVLIEGKDARKVPTEFFILNIPIKGCDSWLQTKFNVENRDIAPQNPNHMHKIIKDESIPYYKRLADFHLLLFLSNVFDMKTDMPRLCTAVQQGENIDEGYRLMIENMASS